MVWDASEDTTETLDSLYAAPMEYAPGFGRGRFGGVDLEARGEAAEFYAALARKRAAQDPSLVVPKSEAQVWAARKGTSVVGGKNWRDKTLSEMTRRDWNIVREDHDIKVSGSSQAVDTPPLRAWADLGKFAAFPPSLSAGIYDAGYTEPTPIQMQGIPIGLLGVDLIGLAETGSGKTAAFLIPLLARLSYLPRVTPELANSGPYALILAPTRELAQQIQGEVVKFAAEVEPPLSATVIVGGMDETDQRTMLSRGHDIIIATPGRVNSLLTHRFLALNRCFYVILDEADRMIDMGFAPQVQNILDAMPVAKRTAGSPDLALGAAAPPNFRQTVMFSATMATEVFHLAKQYMFEPVTVEIGKVGRAVDRIKQVVQYLPASKKTRALVRLLRRIRNGLIIVFVNEKSTCATLADSLAKERFAVTTMHGGKSQKMREAALESFRSGARNIIVATDVLGRGIDVPNVTHVINYDMPSQMEVYTHRIGRTARAGKRGEAHTFITDANSAVFYFLKKFLRETNQPIPHALDHHEAALVRPGVIAPV